MAEYEQLDHMVKAPDSSTSNGNHYYLPHHGVLKPDSATTKLRVVFNGSSPTTSGYSANVLMHTGANLYLEIADVLIWIRHHRHIFATHITKMFRQIKVHKDDWDLQRILWVDDKHREVPHQLTTVTYGTKSAPFLAVRSLLQLAEDAGHRFPLAMPSFSRGRYVDDLFGGADSSHELIEIAQQLKSLCGTGGFPLAKWYSTHPDLLKAISSTRLDQTDISFDDCETKILGIKWHPRDDVFTFATTSSNPASNLTKRLILSEVAQIFDPLGFISPIVIRAKMLLQELWLHKIGWDDPLPSHLSTRWLVIREDLKSLARLSVPRWFNTWSDSTVEIHGFSDASQLAISAVLYMAVSSPPTGAKTSPSAALLLTKLLARVQATLDLNISSTHLWTDSQVALTWIRAHASRWKDFVRNRVTQIQELSQGAQGRHVPGTSNPADYASRGITTAQLKLHALWWTGPPWITQPQSSWPKQTDLAGSKVHLKLDQASHYLWQRPRLNIIGTSYTDIRHFQNCYVSLICFRIVSLFKRIPNALPPMTLSSEDISGAEAFWVKSTQALYFSQETTALSIQSPLPSTHPFNRLIAFIDASGIVRVGGQLDHSTLPQNAKHPAILPRHSQLTQLVISQAHTHTLHGGTQAMLAHLRESYWILRGRAPVKAHVLRCVRCARQRGIRAHQLMGQLPLSRVTPSRPFSHTGVDYAGPIRLKTWKGTGAKTQKGWICVFVCFSTSAVHLEAVSDYSTEGFLVTYRRFVSRRGMPYTTYSDCGTNFQGADASLIKLFLRSSTEHHRITSTLSIDRTQWKFNPPTVPHMGGEWESMVKLTKFHLKRTVGDTLLTFEEFSTILSQIEAVLNSRPLEPLSDDPDDISALTPGLFLIGNTPVSIPEPSLVDLAASRLSHWQLIQRRTLQFWSQWSSHYRQRQQAISKWHHPSNEIKVGSLVLLSDEPLSAC